MRELKEDILPCKFATVVLSSLPESYDNFLTGLNARDANSFQWDNIKQVLIEEYMKCKEKNEKQKNEDALFIRKGGNFQEYSGRNRGGGNFRNEANNIGHFENYHSEGKHQASYQNKNRGGPKCWTCCYIGHISRYCRNLRNKEGNVAVHNIDDCSKMRNLDKKDDNHCSINQIILQSDDIALTSNSNNVTSKTEWFIDSVASSHMTYDKTIFMDFVSYGQPSQVFLGDDTVISAAGEGKVRLPTHNDDVYIALNKVLFVPKLAKNLLSVHAMTKMGAEVTFDKEKCVILKDNKKFTVGHILDGKLYRVNTHEFANFTATCNVPSVEFWHLRLGHLNQNYVEQLAKKDLIVGMKYKNVSGNFKMNCEACTLGKMHRSSFPKQSQHRATQLLEIIHSDICGPMQVESIGGSKYMLMFTDDYSRYTTVYFLKNKNEVIVRFKHYVSQVENRTGHYIKKSEN